MRIYECEQGSREWFEAKLGIPTASEFTTVMASGRGSAPSKTRQTYMFKLAGERLTGEPMDGYRSAHMDRGVALEPEARALYAFMHDAEVKQVGFVRHGDTGCSPDGLIGDDGLVEIKTALPHILIPHLLSGAPPPEHRAQVQGQLWVTGREWCDLVVYWPKLPLFVDRTYRDEPYIAELEKGVERFNAELAALVDRLRRYGDEVPPPASPSPASTELTPLRPYQPPVDLSTQEPVF